MDSRDLLMRVMMLVPMILSLSVHEWAHAWSAFKLGDDTAARMGRLTLNPLAHIDPFGTLLLPLLGVPFGWAKPVPVNPAGFRRDVSMRTGMMITAVAGPLSNVILALLAAVTWGLLLRFAPDLVSRGSAGSFFLRSIVLMNVGLALFNMLPIPPLDGSRVLDGVMPERLRPTWDSITQLSPFLLLGAVFLISRTGLLAGPTMVAIDLLEGVIRLVRG